VECENFESRRKIGKFEKGNAKNEVSILGVSEVRRKGQSELRSGDYTLYYSGDERAEIV
jgi:hypothetical protein